MVEANRYDSSGEILAGPFLKPFPLIASFEGPFGSGRYFVGETGKDALGMTISAGDLFFIKSHRGEVIFHQGRGLRQKMIENRPPHGVVGTVSEIIAALFIVEDKIGVTHLPSKPRPHLLLDRGRGGVLFIEILLHILGKSTGGMAVYPGVLRPDGKSTRKAQGHAPLKGI